MVDVGGVAHVRDADALRALVGRDLGPSAWVEITPEVVDAFARAVDDWHWAHNDPDRAAAGPFGGTIGHAHLSPQPAPAPARAARDVHRGRVHVLRLRPGPVPTAVPVGTRVRLHGTVVAVDEIAGGKQLTLDLRLEIEGSERPRLRRPGPLAPLAV